MSLSCLRLFPSVAINTQPVNTNGEIGSTIILSVGVTGYDVFQWFRDRSSPIAMVDNGRISGATTATLTITNAKSFDAGDYFVDLAVSSNPAQTDQSDPATVTVQCKCNLNFPVKFLLELKTLVHTFTPLSQYRCFVPNSASRCDSTPWGRCYVLCCAG